MEPKAHADERRRAGTGTSALTGTISAPHARIENMRLLVVDDDEGTRAVLRDALDLCGAAVCAVSSAAMARRAIAQWRPTAFISDVDMPGEDGYALIRYVRRLPASEGGALPAIAFTGYASDESRMLDAGFDAVVAKPVALDTLIRTIVHVVDCSRGLGADATGGEAEPARDS
ncbi:MAG TPA: response regulator [Casimicrobiaceae bacterium]|nr:response regulator [Casimicrobiaceae bacterium]